MSELATVVPMPVSDQVISEMAQSYKGLTADTKEGYEEVRQAIQVCVKTRTGIEAKRKELNEDALKWQRTVNAEAKRLTGLVEAIEDPLKAKKKAVDDEVERKRKELEERHRARIQARVDDYVTRCGKSIAFDYVAAMSDDLWQEFVEAEEKDYLAKVEAEAKRKSVEDAERKRLAEELEAQRQAMEAQRLEAKRIQDELDQLKREKAEADRVKAQAEQAERDRIEAQKAKDQAEAEAKAKRDQDEELQARKKRAIATTKVARKGYLADLEAIQVTLEAFDRPAVELAIGPQLEAAIEAIKDLAEALRNG